MKIRQLGSSWVARRIRGRNRLRIPSVQRCLGPETKSDRGGAEEVLVFAGIILMVIALLLGFVIFGIPDIVASQREENRRDAVVDAAASDAAADASRGAESTGDGVQTSTPHHYILKPGKYKVKLVEQPSRGYGIQNSSWTYMSPTVADVTESQVKIHFVSLNPRMPYYCHVTSGYSIVYYNRDHVGDIDHLCRHLPADSELPYNAKKKHVDWAVFRMNKGFAYEFNFWGEDAGYSLVPL